MNEAQTTLPFSSDQQLAVLQYVLTDKAWSAQALRFLMTKARHFHNRCGNHVLRQVRFHA